MKRKLLMLSVTIVLLLGLLVPAYAFADSPTQSGVVSNPGGDPAMPLDGSWVTLDEYMNVGDYFTGPYTWDEPYLVRFTITDIWVVSDRFEVYDDGGLVATTPAMPDWDDLGLAGPKVSPPWTGNPDTALADGRFSSAVLYFGPGAHSIDIRDIHIPPTTAGGNPFPDGTVAFKAEPLVEFDKEIISTVEAGDMDGVLETGEDWHWTMKITLKNVSGETIAVDKLHDRLGGDIEWHSVSVADPTKIGALDYYYKGKTDKAFLNWYDGFSLADGEEVSIEMTVSPDVNTGDNQGKGKKDPATAQEFTSPGEHCLNSGAWFGGYIGDEYIEASTAPVCVDVVEAN